MGPVARATWARDELLVFIDWDVVVHRDVFTRVRAALAGDPTLTACSAHIDDDPLAPGIMSGFREARRSTYA